MPVTPGATDQWTTTPEGQAQPGSVQAEYEALVAALLAMLAAELAPPGPGVSWEQWVARVLAGAPGFERRVRDRVAAVDVAAVVERAVGDVVAAAVDAAVADTGWDGDVPDGSRSHVRAILDALAATHSRIVQSVVGVFRAAVDAGRGGDPGRGVQRVLDRFAYRGVTGFVDRSGRNWSLESYVETMVRFQLTDAVFWAWTGVATRAGVRFVRVLPVGKGCPRCLPWTGKLVSLDGSPAGLYEVRGRSGELVTVKVDGRLRDARSDGLFHPWCQHSLAPYPARSRKSVVPSSEMDAREAARYTNRVSRSWERRVIVALSDRVRWFAAGKARSWRSRWRSGRR